MTTFGINTGTPLSAVEAALTYGGDYQITASGDLATIQDTPLYPYATVQRVTFLILTNPRIPNVTGTATSAPDDDCNPDYGVGARAFVGRQNSSNNYNIDAIQRNILNGLANDPYISNSPKPIVTFSSPDGYQSTVLCTVQFWTKSGQNATVTDIPVGGGAT